MPLGPPDMSRTVRRFSFDLEAQDYGAATQNADGYMVDALGPPVVFRGHAFPDPDTGSTDDRLPAGMEGREIIRIHTERDLNVADSAAGTRPTLVTWRGVQYEVFERGRREVARSGASTWGVYRAAKVDRP